MALRVLIDRSSHKDFCTPQWPQARLIFHIALGDLDAARALCEALEPELREDSVS